MINRDSQPQCGTCKHWRQTYSENPVLGNCVVISAYRFADGLAITKSWKGDDIKAGDFEYVRTLKTFGCIFHSDNLATQFV